MEKKTYRISDETRREVFGFLEAMDEAAVDPAPFQRLSPEGLDVLKNILGTNELERIQRLGLSDEDAYAYARVMARGVCSLILQIRHESAESPLNLAMNAMAVGYERGIHDASEGGLSPEAIGILSEKVGREEERGNQVARFRQELEDL